LTLLGLLRKTHIQIEKSGNGNGRIPDIPGIIWKQ
jgi:hypothetical protein